MARDFAAASSQFISLGTGVGNWEYTQAWTIACQIRTKSNASGGILCRQDASANVRGWNFFHRAGTSNPTFALEIRNGAGKRAAAFTTSEFSTGTFRSVIVTYSGSGTVAGITIYVNGASQSLTSLEDDLAGSTILNSVEAMIGARGGVASPNLFGNCILRRLCLYTGVLGSTDRAALDAGTAVPTTGLVAWHEFGPYNDGATLSADWSGNGNVARVVGATYSTTDPSGLADLTPGNPGDGTIPAPLVKTGNPPMLANLGWAGGANTGVGDQIGPGVIIKAGVGDYRGWFENDTGAKSLDVANQPGAFDFDIPTIYGTSLDGYTWTLQHQNDAANAIFSVNNITNALKSALQGETSISALFFDPDDNVWKCWFHGGNNSGTRKIYYATCSGDPSVAGNWTAQNSGNPVLSPGTSGAWDDAFVADGKVVRVSSSLMVMVYRGQNVATGASQGGVAMSTDRGLTWTKAVSNPVLPLGATGSYKDTNIYAGAIYYDRSRGRFHVWFGSQGAQSLTADAISYATSLDALTWTYGAYNPVLTKKDAAGGTNAFEEIIAQTLSVYRDGPTMRLMIKADNGVGGTSGFRGRLEATVSAAPPPMLEQHVLEPGGGVNSF